MRFTANLMVHYKRLLGAYERGELTDKEKSGLINLSRLIIDQYSKKDILLKKLERKNREFMEKHKC